MDELFDVDPRNDTLFMGAVLMIVPKVMVVMGATVSAWRHWDPLEVVILAATLFAAMSIYLRSRSPHFTEGC